MRRGLHPSGRTPAAQARDLGLEIPEAISDRIESDRRSTLVAEEEEEEEHISPSPAGRRVGVRVRSEAINSASRVAVALWRRPRNAICIQHASSNPKSGSASGHQHLITARACSPPSIHAQCAGASNGAEASHSRGDTSPTSIAMESGTTLLANPPAPRTSSWIATATPSTKHPRAIALPVPTCHHQPTPLHRQQRSAYRAQLSSLVSR